MGFKEDADFARFVSMGAVGTAAVGRFLRTRHEHHPIELERYAMANKVWQTKVKRLRLPDLVCTRCGRRVESRAKSSLGVVLSQSDVAGRAWDEGGMRADDLFAFARADLSRFPPYVSAPTFFTTAALSDALNHARRSAPKAASEGSEVTLTWPAWTPNQSGTFQGVDDKGRLVCEWDNGKVYRYWQWRSWEEPRFAYLDPDSTITAGETIVAGVVAPPSDLRCPGETWDLAESLHSADVVDKYSAVKAAGIAGRVDLVDYLAAIARSPEDWRLQLEALGSLARLDPHSWTLAISDAATDAELPEQQRIEATFVLSELGTPQAVEGLEMVAAPTSGNPSEIRAAAAWGLGQGSSTRPQSLLTLATDDDLLVRLHAAVAIEDLPEECITVLVSWLEEGQPRKAATAAFLLQRHDRTDNLLDAYELGGAARLWSIRALGAMPSTEVRTAAGSRLTPELEGALAPGWLGSEDWLELEGEAGVEALDVQKIRFEPTST
ncbi:MAG: HEAT repeat domain-containing protein [Acidimicrobiia bacterium]